MTSVLSVRDLVVERGGERVLDGVSFDVERGDVVAVTGPSGAGKSTLLRALVRFEPVESGDVLVDGESFRELSPAELRKRVALVAQRPAFVDGSVWENVTVGPRLRGESVDEERVERLLDRLGVAGLAEQDAASVSGGEAQRVAFARTLSNDPEVLLLDEPTANLDGAATARVEELLADVIDAEGSTVVLVTHDPAQARRLADHVLRLEAGRLDPAEPGAEA